MITAKDVLDGIIEEANSFGEHYQPCLRDDLEEARSWVETLIAEALDEVRRESKPIGDRRPR